jgi:prevent-host-death family protein
MNPIPYTIPISDLRFHQTQVIDRLAEAPVVLTKQGRAAAVLVSPEYWNRVIEELEDFADALVVAQAKLALARGEEDLVEWDEVKRELGEVALNAV